jgi:hypothetical protein
MPVTSHPSAEQLRDLLRERDVTLACTVCGHETFAIEEASIRASGGRNYYGNQRLLREQVICEHCGHVMSFSLDVIRAGA